MFKHYPKTKQKPKRYQETGFQKYMLDDEWRKIKEYVITKMYTSPPSQAAILTLMYTGRRRGEIVRLKRSDFNKDFSILRYQPLKKRNKIVIHQIPITPQLQKWLYFYDKRYSKYYRDGYMFPPWKNQSKNKHLQASTLSYWIVKITEKLGINEVYYKRSDGKILRRLSAHTFRHFAAFRFHNASDKNLRATQQFLCHEKIDTTAGYIMALRTIEEAKEVVDKAWSGL